MGETGREPSCVTGRPPNVVEEIALAYRMQSDGDPSMALRQAIGDALADLLEMERRTNRAERLISRGFVRSGSRPLSPTP